MSSPFVWGPDGHALHLGHGSILDRHGHHVFPKNSFAIVQTDYGTAPVAEMRNAVLTLSSHDESIKIEGDHNSKTVNFSISKDFIGEIVKSILAEINKEKKT